MRRRLAGIWRPGRFRDAIEYQQAQLRVEQADQRVLESHERNVHLQTQATEANARVLRGRIRLSPLTSV
jgi:hypothetical protein